MKLINCNAWRSLCDYVYDAPDFTLPWTQSVVYVSMDHIDRFFSDVEEHYEDNDKFIVISACSDYGITLQDENPIWQDMKKWFDFVPIDENLGYNPLLIPQRCDTRFCKITDIYSVKMHAFTKSTFNKIPKSIAKWYCTNCDIKDGRVVPIPFGIPDWSQKLIEEARAKNLHTESDRTTGFYINFQNNTAERVAIKNRYQGGRMNTAKVISNEISHEDYINNLLSSIYVVSPPGNGYDSYRVLESLYCGAIPIVANTRPFDAYSNLPVIKIDNFGYLEQLQKEAGFKIFQNDLVNTTADMDYWSNNLLESRQALLES